MNPQIAYLLNLSIQQIQSGRLQDAEQNLQKVIKLEPKNADAFSFLSIVFAYRMDYEAALIFIEKSILFDPKNSHSYNNKGNILKELGRLNEAFQSYKKSIHILSSNPEPYNNLGNLQQDLGQYHESLSSYETAIKLNPNYVEAYSNKGNALEKIGRYDESIKMYQLALNLKPDYIDAWLNMGMVLNKLKKFNEALGCCDTAISLNSNYPLAWTKKGIILNENGYHLEALQFHDKAVSIDPNRAESWADRASCLIDLKRYEEAINSYQKAQQNGKGFDFLYGDLIYAKLHIAFWDGLNSEIDEVSKGILADKKVINPFKLFSISDSLDLANQSAKIWVQTKYPEKNNFSSLKKQRHSRVRIGYFSADFRSHPVSLLTAELFKLHDRESFEIYAFSCMDAESNDEMRVKLKNRFDHFVEIQGLADLDAVELVRKYEIDIAVDLGGHTQFAPTGIMSYRVAPIQVNYLGFPGTMGAKYMDYIIADKILIPEQYQKSYQEKIVYLPDSYMVDDSERMPSQKIFTRSDFGLPANDFIFCCFNNGYKFNKKIIESWSRILLAAKDSVLWLSKNNDSFNRNIVSEFEKLGIPECRLIFASRVDSMADHLSRYSLADLFLDTSPFNAHSTAVDALKGGVPLITCPGENFASRVAASLLNALSLPECITSSLEEYENLAIELALDSEKLINLKKKLCKNVETEALFNTERFTKNIEKAYREMYRRYLDDRPLDHIYVNKNSVNNFH